MTDSGLEGASTVRTCVECGEPWPCDATVRNVKDGIPHRLAASPTATGPDGQPITDWVGSPEEEAERASPTGEDSDD